jgi:hypothetical protein
VTQEWPLMLNVDAVAMALFVGTRAFARTRVGLQFVDARIVRKSIGDFQACCCAASSAGIRCSGRLSELIRAEALVRLDCEAPLPSGMLALGKGPNSRSRRGTGRNC